MRTYRFVRFLGDLVETASREVAATADHARDTDEQLPGGERTDHNERVRRALPRTVASHLNGARKGPAALSAMTVVMDEQSPRAGDTTPDLGVVYHASVPDYEQVTAMVAKVVDARVLDDPEYSLAETNESAAIDRLLSITSDAFVFVVADRRVQVVPAQSVRALTSPAKRQTPHTELYTRRLGRTFEEFVEGFVGDATIGPSLSASDSRADVGTTIRDWAAEHQLKQVLFVGLEATEDEGEATLQDFV